jgi:hypothetical protein
MVNSDIGASVAARATQIRAIRPVPEISGINPLFRDGALRARRGAALLFRYGTQGGAAWQGAAALDLRGWLA